MVAHHVAEHATPDFAVFIDRHPALLDKRLLIRFYRPTTLASTQARTGWVEPDLAPFPWQGIDQEQSETGDRTSTSRRQQGDEPQVQAGPLARTVLSGTSQVHLRS
ncbi:hypothetical protein SAMN04489713_10726 [Actinomadura madurae]|uniref:Uncharacterized protein n=2 Tax=Actinomadura madurae TaxID=1993 RepID=A0A1I5HZ64_9ACTN|nr:hypothetical protein SAMN04489713_10726 [Actinomadura madurae]